jgi:hypothetical protein
VRSGGDVTPVARPERSQPIAGRVPLFASSAHLMLTGRHWDPCQRLPDRPRHGAPGTEPEGPIHRGPRVAASTKKRAAAASSRPGDLTSALGQEHAPAVTGPATAFNTDGYGCVLALRRPFASAARAGSALPSAGESSHAGVRRSTGRGCPLASAAQGVVDVKIAALLRATSSSRAESGSTFPCRPYFAVESLEAAQARVHELGGRVLTEPTKVPSGAFVAVLDPQSAAVSMLAGDLDP